MPEPSLESPPLPATHTGPGLVDLQLNGYAGVDFNAPTDAWRVEHFHHVRNALRRRGCVAALPTFITDAPARLLARAERFADWIGRDAALAQTFPKFHLEGPFIAPDDGPRGAHPRAHCATPRDLPDLLARLVDAGAGRLGLLTLAPELPGALALIERAAGQGICVALGHTQASTDVIRAAVNAGARLSTHLGNGSHQLLPRLDNYVQAQLAEDDLFASFIADGHHLPWFTLKNFIRAKTPARTLLVTDAVAAAEAGPGRYRLGEQEIVATPEGFVARPGHPGLAGSALTLDRAVVNVATRCGIPFAEAWAMASTRPAALVGLPAPPRIAVSVSEEGFCPAACA